MTSNGIKMWDIFDKLFVLSCKVAQVTIKEDKIYDKDNNLIDYCEFEYIEIPPFDYEDDFINGILLFGDGTLELHLEESEDALNWSEFDYDTLLKVEKVLTEMVGN